MYALCVSGAVNTQGFVWKFFMPYIKKNHSFIHIKKNKKNSAIQNQSLIIINSEFIDF